MAEGEVRSDTLRKALRVAFPREQDELREALRQEGDYLSSIAHLFFHNPFFRLTDDEAQALGENIDPRSLSGLISSRHAAMHGSARRYSIFCMPKSGSSFLVTAVSKALDLPIVSLTTFGASDLSSHFGMNGREQEIDELALVKSVLIAPLGFVARHHTRFTLYLGLQLRMYRVKPILTRRNILDVLVSFDDMMMDGRQPHDPRAWTFDSPIALPVGYAALESDARYRILGASLGIWLIQFHLSWLRCVRQGLISPLVLSYEEDVLDPERLIPRLTAAFGLDEAQQGRLRKFAERPDRDSSRLNVGKAGRGRERIPDDVRQSLLGYAAAFADEIPQADIDYLLG